MSLVVAKKEVASIYIVSDTKLTNPENINRVKLAAPEEFSAIKTAIINPFVSVSFAGDVSYAHDAISVCRKIGFKIDEIIKHLLDVNNKSKNEIEFIVCISLPPFFIYEIKDSKSNSVSSAWIGDIEGFNKFQESFLSSDKADFKSKMDGALAAVIESNVQGISGFAIAVSNDDLRFSYREYMKTYMPPRTYSGGLHVLEVYGTVGEGGYTVNLFTNEESTATYTTLMQ